VYILVFIRVAIDLLEDRVRILICWCGDVIAYALIIALTLRQWTLHEILYLSVTEGPVMINTDYSVAMAMEMMAMVLI
jgi:hypothetical protein